MAKTAITVKIFFMAKIYISLKIKSLSDIPFRASFGKMAGAVVGTVLVWLIGNLKQWADTNGHLVTVMNKSGNMP